MKQMYINYGCGLCAPTNWLNFDGSPRLWLERKPILAQLIQLRHGRLFPENVRYGNIVTGLPIPDGSATAAYASHVLEHLSRCDIERALANTFRILRPGGTFRLVVPDLEWRAEVYLRQRQEYGSSAADSFIESCHIGVRDTPHGLFNRLRAAYGHTGHHWMYDFGTISSLMLKAGFIDVRRCAIGDSGDRMFDAVEVKERFYEHGEAELAVQARKP